MAYASGLGLDRAATQRLRERVTPGTCATAPACRDKTAQVRSLLGNGAKKVQRCSACTRPLDPQAADAKSIVCTRCSASDKKKLEEKAAKVQQRSDELATAALQDNSPLNPVHFLRGDADEGVVISSHCTEAACDSEDAWLGVRAQPGVLKGAYYFEFELLTDCLLRVGWGAPSSRRALGTDERSFGYGGTAMKSHANKFEPYGQVHEGMAGAVITCLLDRRDPRKQTISYWLNGEDLGIAFRPPLWMADVPFLPALCGREDWQVRIRGTSLRYAVPSPYRPLGEILPEDAFMGDGTSAHEVSRMLFAPAPHEERREIEGFDVPDANLLELRSQGDETLDEDHLLEWLEQQCEVPRASWRAKFSDSGHVAIIAFMDHRASQNVAHVPPPLTEVHRRDCFSDAADTLLQECRPEHRAGTTDRVARRFIAGALADDPALTKEQLREIRVAAVAAGTEPDTCYSADDPKSLRSVSTRERSWRSRSRPERPGASRRLRPDYRDSSQATPTREGKDVNVKAHHMRDRPQTSDEVRGERTGDGARSRLQSSSSGVSRLLAGALRPLDSGRKRGRPRNAFD